MKRYIQYPRVAGTASRQAHADLPAGTFEREMSKEGFFGPAAFFYHRHPPTGWTSFEGPLRPHAFDLAGLKLQAAADRVVQQDLTKLGGQGGVIAVMPDGQMAWSFNTSGMYRARVAHDQPLEVAIYKDET